jgi:hypothetical protein
MAAVCSDSLGDISRGRLLLLALLAQHRHLSQLRDIHGARHWEEAARSASKTGSWSAHSSSGCSGKRQVKLVSMTADRRGAGVGCALTPRRQQGAESARRSTARGRAPAAAQRLPQLRLQK